MNIHAKRDFAGLLFVSEARPVFDFGKPRSTKG
jgi:hypothetical protein